MPLRISTGLRNKLMGIKTNELSNGSFTTDAAGWTANLATLASVAGGQSGNCLQVTNSGAAQGSAYQDFTATVGRLYKATYYTKVGTSATHSVKIGTTGTPNDYHDSGALSDADWPAQAYVAYFMPTEATVRVTLEVGSSTGAETSLFDEVKVEEVLDGFQEIFRECFLNIYTGNQPAAADNAAAGTLLVTIYSDGVSAGLTFEEAIAGVVNKPTGVQWTGAALATGTAAWGRLYENTDDPSLASTTKARLDGTVAVSGGNINMSSTSIVQSAIQTVTSFPVTMPANA